MPHTAHTHKDRTGRSDRKAPQMEGLANSVNAACTAWLRSRGLMGHEDFVRNIDFKSRNNPPAVKDLP